MSRTQKFLPWAALLLAGVAYAADDCEAEKVLTPLVKIDPKTFEYKGLNEDGIAALKRAREALKSRVTLFDSEFRRLGSIHHAGTVARLFAGNMFLYGPPGGAKSAVVNWLLSGENTTPFKLQLHQMITEQAFVGGQNFEAAKEGRFEINTEGSLASYIVALFDEIEKGNPAALASLMSLLNEREVLVGGKTVKAQLETLFATSNANLAEFLQQFVENGQGSTAPALLNRFQFKALVYNWLSPEDQAKLDERRERRTYLKALSATHPEALKNELFLKPPFVDWTTLRQLAFSTMQLSPVATAFYREVVNDLRGQTNLAIRESETRHQNNQLEEPFVYHPSADYSERLRQQIPEIVILSAFVDLLQSPISDKDLIAELSKGRLQLDASSIWRAYLVATTVGPGQARLQYAPDSDEKLDINFDWTVEPSTARDAREEALIKNLKAEQERFRRTFLKHLLALQEHVELAARFAPGGEVRSGDEISLEALLIRMRENSK